MASQCQFGSSEKDLGKVASTCVGFIDPRRYGGLDWNRQQLTGMLISAAVDI